jgi:hypothetical protein
LEAREYSDSGSAEEPGILQWHGQGCVERSGGLEDPNLPLSAPAGVQRAPTSPKLVDGKFSEVRQKSFKDHQSGEQNVGIPMP